MILSVINKYVWVLNLVLIAGIAYIIAGTVNSRIKDKVYPLVLVASASHGPSISTSTNTFRNNRSKNRGSYNEIVNRNIFGVGNPKPFRPGDGPDIPNGDHPLSTLSLELVGTIIRSQTEVESSEGSRMITKERKSKAILKESKSGKTRGYSEGDLIDIIENESVKLVQVDNCKAFIRRASNKVESINCKREMGGTVVNSGPHAPISTGGQATPLSTMGVHKINETRYEIDKQFLEETLADPTPLFTQVRVLPQEDGIKFVAVRRKSLFYQIGLRNADVINQINDVRLDNVENALGMFEELRNQENFTIDITRRGKKLTLEYIVK